MQTMLWDGGVPPVRRSTPPLRTRLRGSRLLFSSSHRLLLAILVSAVAHLGLATWLWHGSVHSGGTLAPETARRIQVGTGRTLAVQIERVIEPVASFSAPAASSPAPGNRAAEVLAPGATAEHPGKDPEHPIARSEMTSGFLRAADVDREAYPIGTPDLAPLDWVRTYSGKPIRLRLYVDAHGRVVDVKILDALEEDEEAAALLVQVWERVDFVPARLRAADVSSYMDIDFQLADRTGDTIVR